MPGAPLKVRDCRNAVLGAARYGNGINPTLSLTVMVQAGWNTQLTAGALTSTTVSGCARAASMPSASAATAPAATLKMRIFALLRRRSAAIGAAAISAFDSRR